jgi:hypothetical protein
MKISFVNLLVLKLTVNIYIHCMGTSYHFLAIDPLPELPVVSCYFE